MSDPTNAEIMKAIKDLEGSVNTLSSKFGDMQDAFLDNDIGKKDYDGHRRDHAIRRDNEKHFAQLKMAGAMRVVGAAAILGVTIFGTGLSAYLKQLLGV